MIGAVRLAVGWKLDVFLFLLFGSTAVKLWMNQIISFDDMLPLCASGIDFHG